jgi:dihydroxyacetone kinase
MIVDTALKNSKDVLIVTVCRVGQFSAKLLSLSIVAAFGTEPPRLIETKARYISEYDAANLLKDCGFPVNNGVVLLRSDVKKGLRTLEGVLEVRVDGEMAFDHALSLLGALNAETR